jgi:hypothetical protein
MEQYIFLDNKLSTIVIDTDNIEYISYIVRKPYLGRSDGEDKLFFNEYTDKLFRCNQCKIFCTRNHMNYAKYDPNNCMLINWQCKQCEYNNYITNTNKLE